jgi:hypothetical protein
MRPAGLPSGIGYFLIGGQSAASHNGRSSPRWLMEWIGRFCMRTMLRGRPQRRESCQGAGYSSQPSPNLILSYACPIDAVADDLDALRALVSQLSSDHAHQRNGQALSAISKIEGSLI